MYQVGDQVIYGVHGVCRIVQEEKRTVDRRQVTYLVLEPTGQRESSYMVPTHNTSAMSKLRPLLTGEALEALLCSEQAHGDIWIPGESLRKQRYREYIGSAQPLVLAQMVCTLHRHKLERSALGKKVHMSDENFLRDAERLLVGEASVVLQIGTDEAKDYIRSKLYE